MADCIHCGKPLPAYVPAGNLCPDCAKRTVQSREPAQPSRGAALGSMVAMFPVTTALMALNFLVFIAMAVRGASLTEPTPAQLIQWGADFVPLTLGGQWWRIFTCMFVHVGLIHIATNMWCLWSIGPLAERVFGRWTYILIYIYTGVSASLLSLASGSLFFLQGRPLVPSAGASGAIFGVAGALIPAFYFGKLPFPPQAVKATVRSLVIFAIINLAIGAEIPGIDNAGHIGGLILGLILGALLSRSLAAPPETRRTAALVTFSVLGLVLFYGERFVQHNAGFIVPYYAAEAALARGDDARAVAALSAVVAQQPRLTNAQFQLGNTLLYMKQYQRAEGPLAKVAELSPNSAAAWVQLCYLHDEMKKFDQAYSECEKALALIPNNAAALDNQASALIGLKKYDEAIAILGKLTKEHPEMLAAWNDLGQAYAESGHNKEAADAYQQALKIDPKNKEAQEGAEAAFEHTGRR